MEVLRFVRNPFWQCISFCQNHFPPREIRKNRSKKRPDLKTKANLMEYREFLARSVPISFGTSHAEYDNVTNNLKGNPNEKYSYVNNRYDVYNFHIGDGE
jgi:hypothetical protein